MCAFVSFTVDTCNFILIVPGPVLFLCSVSNELMGWKKVVKCVAAQHSHLLELNSAVNSDWSVSFNLQRGLW